MKPFHLNGLEQLDQIINYIAAHIHDFISDPHAFTRKRRLSVAITIKTTINMQGDCLDTELRHAFGDEQVMSTSAYIQQKRKLSPDCFHYILHGFNQNLPCRQLLDSKYRVFAIDGSDFNQLWNPESQNIVKFSNNQKKPYCQIHVNALYDLLNILIKTVFFQPRAKMDERTAAVQMLKRLDVGPYIVIMDRGYSAFNLIENCNRLPNCYYLVRTKAGRSGIKKISALPDQEYDDDLAC